MCGRRKEWRNEATTTAVRENRTLGAKGTGNRVSTIRVGARPSPPSPEPSSAFAFALRTFGGKDGGLGALGAPLFTLGSPVDLCCVVSLLLSLSFVRLLSTEFVIALDRPCLFLPSKHVYADARVNLLNDQCKHMLVSNIKRNSILGLSKRFPVYS